MTQKKVEIGVFIYALFVKRARRHRDGRVGACHTEHKQQQRARRGRKPERLFFHVRGGAPPHWDEHASGGPPGTRDWGGGLMSDGGSHGLRHTVQWRKSESTRESEGGSERERDSSVTLGEGWYEAADSVSDGFSEFSQ